MSEPASDTSPPTIAPHPFNQPSADLTLRTPDRVDFHVHSPILAQASPVFTDMLSLPQPSAISRDVNTDRPVVDVTEDSKTLGRLLHLCYPIAKERLEDLEDIVPVLQAAMKYDMDWPISFLTMDLRAILPSAPLKVWAVACRCRLDALAQEAASAMVDDARGGSMSEGRKKRKSCLRRTTSPLALLTSMLQERSKEILHEVSAGDYFRLREYLRAAVGTARTQVLSSTIKNRASSHDLPTQSSPLPSLIPSFPPPDVVLRCPDGIKYRAHTLSLILHSPALAERIRTANASPPSDPQNRADDADSPSLSLDVDIDSATLSILLAVMYGGNAQLPSDLRSLGSTLVEAARLGITGVEEAAQDRWNSLATSSPLEAYFIAIERGLADCARFAARQALKHSIVGTYVRAMEESTALTYHNLLEYYQACASLIERRMVAAVARWNQALRGVLLNSQQHDASDSTVRFVNIDIYLMRFPPPTRTSGDVGPGQGWRFDLTLPALLRESYTMLPSSLNATLYKEFTEVLTNISAELPQILTGAIAEVQLEIQ